LLVNVETQNLEKHSVSEKVVKLWLNFREYKTGELHKKFAVEAWNLCK